MGKPGRTATERTATGRTITREEILAQIPAAVRREKAARAAGLRATGASYDPTRKRIVMELSNGAALAVPISVVHGLTTATASERAALRVTPSGSGILWPALDTDLSVPGAIELLLGRKAVAQALGRRGGLAKSPAKALASRANGARGGRPRKKAGKARSSAARSR